MTPRSPLLGCLPVQIDINHITERVGARFVSGVDEGIDDHGRSEHKVSPSGAPADDPIGSIQPLSEGRDRELAARLNYPLGMLQFLPCRATATASSRELTPRARKSRRMWFLTVSVLTWRSAAICFVERPCSSRRSTST